MPARRASAPPGVVDPVYKATIFRATAPVLATVPDREIVSRLVRRLVPTVPDEASAPERTKLVRRVVVPEGVRTPTRASDGRANRFPVGVSAAERVRARDERRAPVGVSAADRVRPAERASEPEDDSVPASASGITVDKRCRDAAPDDPSAADNDRDRRANRVPAAARVPDRIRAGRAVRDPDGASAPFSARSAARRAIPVGVRTPDRRRAGTESGKSGGRDRP
jgi:hypothetical protein